MNLYQVAEEISRRLSSLFLADKNGRRPVYGATRKFQDPHWRDHLLFYEYFHGVGRAVGCAEEALRIGLVLGEEQRGSSLTEENSLAEIRM